MADWEDYEPTNDYEDQMDAIQLGLLSYDDTHCIHGTFVGNWAGPDYMCGPCEMGETLEEFQEGKRLAAEANEKRRHAREQWEQLNLRHATGEEQLAFIESEEGKWLFQ